MATAPRKENRICFACQAPRPKREGPDPCLGWLEGVAFACCGHGHGRMSYIVMEADVPPEGHFRETQARGEDRALRQEAARVRMRELGGNPPENIYPDDGPVPTLGQSWPRVID